MSNTTLGITSALDTDFDSDASLDARLGKLGDALGKLRSQASAFGSNLAIVENRNDFTKSMINTLETGAANLTLADTNQEAANLPALRPASSELDRPVDGLAGRSAVLRLSDRQPPPALTTGGLRSAFLLQPPEARAIVAGMTRTRHSEQPGQRRLLLAAIPADLPTVSTMSRSSRSSPMSGARGGALALLALPLPCPLPSLPGPLLAAWVDRADLKLGCYSPTSARRAHLRPGDRPQCEILLLIRLVAASRLAFTPQPGNRRSSCPRPKRC